MQSKNEPGILWTKQSFFSNTCVAMKSGFMVWQCRKTPIEGEDNANEKPISGNRYPVDEPLEENGVCTRNIDPVYCGSNNSYFTNLCYATRGGFTVSQCHNSLIEGENNANETPISGNRYLVNVEIGEQGGCTRNIDQVYCGPNTKYFINVCVAMRGGFTVSQCRRTVKTRDKVVVYARSPTLTIQYPRDLT